MKYTTFGKTGITVSRLCLGCMSYGGGDLPDWALGTRGWHVNKEDAREHFAIALEAGINFFDTADVYSIGRSEEITGAHLKAMAQRDDIVVATKVHGAMGPGPNRRGLSRKHIIEACENRCAASKWITWICTRSIAGILYRRSKRLWTPSIRWCRAAKSVIWVRAAWPHGSSRKPCTRRKSTAGTASSPCRITTTWCIARKSAK